MGVGYDMYDNEAVSYEGLNEFTTDLYSRKAVEVIAKHNKSRLVRRARPSVHFFIKYS